jgi:imidazolonepropionase-like amidohydrolase
MARTLITDAFVLIDGARIAAVGPDLGREADMDIVDGSDRIVIAGSASGSAGR